MYQPSSTFAYSFDQHPLGREARCQKEDAHGSFQYDPFCDLRGPTDSRRMCPRSCARGPDEVTKEAVSKRTGAAGSFNEAPAAEASRPS